MIKLHPQIRRLVITIATAVSSLAALLVFFVIGFSENRAIAVFWSADHKRHEILIDRGSMLLHTLHKYQFKTNLNWSIYKPETPKELVAFTELTAWWHGDNSWWERVGTTVKKRYRLIGFEYAEGTYWPPFVWRHPTVPFNIVQLPCWGLAVIFMILPVVRVFRWCVLDTAHRV
jgi:hypothetical protein